jgi:hypothetical protein
MITMAITAALRMEFEFVATTTASSAQQAVRRKPTTATSLDTTRSDMIVALTTSTTPISFTQRAEAGIPQERKVVAKPVAAAKVAHPR